MKNFILLCLFTAGFFACVKFNGTPGQASALVPELPGQYYNYADQDISALAVQPLIFDNFIPDAGKLKLTDMGVTDAGATLGRVLFYDKRLSVNNTVSCGTCHKQGFAFSDQLAGSSGFEGRVTPRNTPSIINPVAGKSFFWDSRSNSLEDLSLRPVQNHLEMGMESMESLKTKLRNTSFYPQLFVAAFGAEEINEGTISSALSQFLRSMVTLNSKFDQGLASGFSNYTPLERMGKDLFESTRTNCSQCHKGNNFTASEEITGEYGSSSGSLGGANIGLELHYADNGIGNGKFKIPSLRNVALTAPYMHDGRFNTLMEVVNQYNNAIQPHASLDHNLKEGNTPKRMNLNEIEKEALVAFLGTLTDYSFIQDPKFSNPFK